MAKEKKIDLLQDWALLNEKIGKLTEDELHLLLGRERNGACRVSFLLRIYGRINRLRTSRERTELLQSIARQK